MLTRLLRTLLLPILPAALAVVVVGCVERSSTIVTFDEVLESTTFENRLLAPVVIFRDAVVLDTIPASSTRTYRLDRRGPVLHAWKLVAPTDRYGRKAGVEPRIELGVQYELNARYITDNELNGYGPDAGRTMFTPLVANFTQWPLRLIANYREEDQVVTDYIVPVNSTIPEAPYYYWHLESNIRLESTVNSFTRDYSRQDSGRYELRMDNSSTYRGTGRTEPISVY